MQRTKKVISALLAVIMLVSIFAFSSSAGAPAPSNSYKITIAYELRNAEGNVITEVTPGETVTVCVYANSSVANDNMTTFINSIYFDEDIYSYVEGSVKWLGIASWVDASNSRLTFMNSSSTDGAYTKSAKLWTADEKKAQPNWDSFLYVSGVQLAGTTYYVQENANSPMYSFELKVSESATPGASADIGCPASVHFANRASYNYIRTVNTGTIGAGEIEPMATYSVSVAAPASASILNPLKSQIRFDKNADGTYAGTFDVRQLAVITKADFENTFGATPEAQKAAIAEVGYVFARTSTVATFDVDAAKALIESGTAAAGYTKLTVDYITTKADLVGEGNYGFSCIVTDIPAADSGDGMFALAYIKDKDGNYHYYPSAKETTFNKLYTDNIGKAFPA